MGHIGVGFFVGNSVDKGYPIGLRMKLWIRYKPDAEQIVRSDGAWGTGCHSGVSGWKNGASAILKPFGSNLYHAVPTHSQPEQVDTVSVDYG